MYGGCFATSLGAGIGQHTQKLSANRIQILFLIEYARQADSLARWLRLTRTSMNELNKFMNPARGFVCVTGVTHAIPVVAINERF